MGSHPVSDQEDMTALPPRFGMRSPNDCVTILIIRTTHPRIRPGCVDDDVVPVHNTALFSFLSSGAITR
jgi:hypothetical protein